MKVGGDPSGLDHLNVNAVLGQLNGYRTPKVAVEGFCSSINSNERGGSDRGNDDNETLGLFPQNWNKALCDFSCVSAVDCDCLFNVFGGPVFRVGS